MISEPEMWKQYRDTNYFVSDQGRVRKIFKNGKMKYNTPYIHHGKEYVKIMGKETMLSRLVYEAFYGPIPKGMCIVHKNGAKTMNDLYNLKMATNEQIGKRFGGDSRRKQIIDLDTGKVYKGTRDAARHLFMSRQTISDICNNKWKKKIKRLRWYE